MTLSQLSGAVASVVALAVGPPDDPPEQTLIALPQLGTLYGSCGYDRRYELRYRAGPWRSETVMLGPRRRRIVHPEQDWRFTGSRVRLAVVSSHKPMDVRARVTMVLVAANDGTGECVALRARMRSSALLR
jgi:hypothetical protein